MATDPYSILGVDDDAGDNEIKRRYLALVREFPPDREPERFQTYRAAFEALHTERQRLAAKLLRPHGGALMRLEASCLPPPEARRNGQVSGPERAQAQALEPRQGQARAQPPGPSRRPSGHGTT